MIQWFKRLFAEPTPFVSRVPDLVFNSRADQTYDAVIKPYTVDLMDSPEMWAIRNKPYSPALDYEPEPHELVDGVNMADWVKPRVRVKCSSDSKQVKGE